MCICIELLKHFEIFSIRKATPTLTYNEQQIYAVTNAYYYNTCC